MTIKVNPSFMKELKSYGAFDIANCFNCGNCTAVCPLSKDENSFPRKMIRKGQVGLSKDMALSLEPWLCYYCGECSETCPREAGPGAYMATLRRYSIASLDPTHLSKYIYKKPLFSILFSIVIAVILALFMVSIKSDKVYPHWIFGLVPYEVIHLVGIVVSAILGVLLFLGLLRLFKHLHLFSKSEFLLPALKELFIEIAFMKRQAECHKESNKSKSMFWDPRIIHLCIMWGFLLLLLATTLDFIFIYFVGMSIFLPARIIGTIGGLFLMYGTSMAIMRRLKKIDKAAADTKLSDMWPLFFLWVLGFTGFWLEIVVTLKVKGDIHDYVLLIHTAMAMELVLFFGITKMAHIIYRPLILLKHFINKKGATNV